MALSNWDCCAIDEKGNPISGTLEEDGIIFDIYKNWLNIQLPDKTSITFNEGLMSIKNMNVYGERDNTGAFYVVIFSGYNDSIKGMAGIGAYGFTRKHRNWKKKLHILLAIPEFLWETLYYLWRCWKNNDMGIFRYSIEMLWDNTCHDESQWTGIKEGHLKFLEEVIRRARNADPLSGYGIPKDKFPINREKILRFNQGDAFFAGAGVIEDIPATKPGESEQPILVEALTKITEKIDKASMEKEEEN